MYIMNIMSNPNIMFIIITLLTLVCALLVIMSKNPIHSILFLVLIFVITTILFLTLNVDFIAMLFLVLYVGAIVVLFLFVVMMLNVRILELNERVISYVPIAITIVLIFFLLILSIVSGNFFDETSTITDSTVNSILFKDYINFINNKEIFYTFFQNITTYNNLNLIAALLYKDYVYLFLLAGMALLVAMLGSIVLTLNRTAKTKRQDFYIQTNKDIVKSIRHLK
jgi:NADH-quinone oxidoreductase subunit J